MILFKLGFYLLLHKYILINNFETYFDKYTFILNYVLL